jgi:pyroglutamyl-peptidase
MVRRAGIPCQVSYHAGTYLCNAMLYLAHHLTQEMQLKTRSAFIHVPLDASQTAAQAQDMASMPASMSAMAVRMILDDLAATPLA